MSYPLFHQIHDELQNSNLKIEPAFHDTNGSPVYEDGYGGLLSHIISRNDTTTLRLYQNSPHTKVFWKAYELPSWHPFFVAARCNSFDALRELLEIYLSDSVVYTEPLDRYLRRIGFSPINVACAAFNKKLALWLLHHVPPLATLRDRDKYGETPLFSAASGLNRGCSVHESKIYRKKEGEDDNPDSVAQHHPELEWTVLGAAITHASYKLVSRLISEGAQVHARQRWWDPAHPTDRNYYSKGVTLLHIASLFWNIEGIHALVDQCGGDRSVAEMVSSADSHGLIPLHWALLGCLNEVKDKKEEVVSQMVSRMMSTVKLLLEANPDIINARDHHGATVFNFAVKSNLGAANILSVVKILLDARPLTSTIKYRDPVGPTALQDAVDHHYQHQQQRGDGNYGQLLELLNVLLDNGANPRLCLHRVCAGMWLESISTVMIDRLLQETDINDIDADGCTAMHYLVSHLDQIDAARHMIRRGADVNVLNDKGNAPLHEVMKGTLIRRVDENGELDRSQPRDAPVIAREEFIRVLVDAGGLMDQVNATGQTPNQMLHDMTEGKGKIAGRGSPAWGTGRGRGRGGRG